MRQYLSDLCALPGVSGFEDAVAAYIRAHAAPYADEALEDPAGNLMFLRRGTGHGKRLMLCAHMDETGLIVTHICPDGLLKFAPVGGFPSRIIPGLQVRVGDAQIPGVVILKPIHLTSSKERAAVPPLQQLRIDLGARSREEAEKLTFPGDFAVFNTKIRDFGENCLAARALDSRIGCAVLLELIKTQRKFDVCYVFSVQRQIGSGIQSAVHRLAPDFALVFDAAEAGGLPGSMQSNGARLGKGVALPAMNGKSCAAPALMETARRAARSGAIPLQAIAQADGGDAEKIAAAVQGVPTLSLRVAVRYPRCAHSIVHTDDMQNLLRLAENLLAEAGDTVFCL